MSIDYTRYVRRIVCQIQEQRHSFHTAILFEVPCEESTCFHIDTHGSEHNGEILFVTIMHTFGGLLHKTGLSTDLSSDFVVWQTGG